ASRRENHFPTPMTRCGAVPRNKASTSIRLPNRINPLAAAFKPKPPLNYNESGLGTSRRDCGVALDQHFYYPLSSSCSHARVHPICSQKSNWIRPKNARNRSDAQAAPLAATQVDTEGLPFGPRAANPGAHSQARHDRRDNGLKFPELCRGFG